MIIDISWPIIQGMTEYKDRSSVKITSLKTMQEHGVYESLLTFHSHTGTHIDTPAHFIEGGKTSEHCLLATFIGPCTVFDVSHVSEKITADDLKDHGIKKGDRILFKTRNSLKAIDAPFDVAFVYLDSSAAEYLVQHSVQLVGIDYLGIERNQKGHETHKLLLQHTIPILEGIRLQNVSAGEYRLICLPLAIPYIDAVPARAVLEIL